MSSHESTPSVPEETDCLVCGSGKSFTKNPILFCDGPDCDIPVHQKCYGVAVVPSGNWYCQRCEDRIPVNNTPSCCCPQKTGAFKRTTIPNQYIHVACAHFHPDLDKSFDPIAFNTSLTRKQPCYLCKSDIGICSKCCIDGCTKMMHVTCAQREDLVTKGKYFELFCENHKDEGALRRIMESQSRKSAFSSSSSSLSSKSSLPSRATKRGSKSYRESSASGSEDDDEDGDEDDDDLDHEDEGSDSEDEEIVRVEEDDDDERRGRNSRSVQQRGYTKNSNSKLSNDATQRRKKQRSSDSEEEIDVDDTEAVLGSGGGGSGASASFGQQSRGKVAKTSAQDSAAEAQRRRLLQRMDKTKKKQSTGGLDKVINLSALPIRTLGGVGPAAPAPSILGSNPSGGVGGAELKQKLPGISRYNNNSGSNSNINSSNSSYAGLDSPSPSLSSSDRFSNNGFMQSNGRGSIDSHGKNTKGLTFELDPGIDAASLKSSRSLSASAAPSPIIPNFSNTGSPNQGRPGERPYPSPRMGYGATVEETREMQSTIQALQQKVATLESTIQNRALQQHGHHHNRNTTPPSGSSSSSSTPSMSTSTATLANPYAVGPPGQDLQHKFNVLQHSHAEEKMRNLTLRQNLKDLFGFLQVPVPGVSTVAEGVQGENSLNNGGRIDWTTERIDDYVQALRDAVVGAENASTVRLDTKRRDVIVDRVMKEIGL